jgi:hypothetical protein
VCKRSFPALLLLVMALACEREPPDLPRGHVRLEDAEGKPVLLLRAREYGYALTDGSGAVRARLQLPRNQAVVKAFIIAGPVRIDLSGSLVTPSRERLRMEVSPDGLRLLDEAGKVAYRLRVDWPNSRSVTVFDRDGKVAGKAVEVETPPGNKVDLENTVVNLTGPGGEPRGRVVGLSARAAALLLLPGLDALERSVFALYLTKFR